MHAIPPLSVEIAPSALKRVLLVMLHVLAALSILLISDYGMAGHIFKFFLFVLLVLSFRRCLSQHGSGCSLYLKADNQADLSAGNRDYFDLQLCNQSYVSDWLMLLIFLEVKTGVLHKLVIFPDALNEDMHSQLRARLKLSANHIDIVTA